MSKITSKLQVTIPRAIADQYAMHPGDEIEFIPAGEVIRVLPPSRTGPVVDVAARLRVFDEATQRQHRREAPGPRRKRGGQRGWAREELYDRGRAR